MNGLHLLFFFFFLHQILMNAPALIQMSVRPKPFVLTLKDPISVAVLLDIRVMGKTAQVTRLPL